MAKSASSPASPPGDPRSDVVEALLRLADLHDWHDIELADIAREAGMPLGRLRDLFPSKGAMLAGFGRMIDARVLAATPEDPATDELAGEPAAERLFDVMMRRIDALSPYKSALKRLAATLRHEPLTLAALNGAALNSWRFMLAAARIPTEDALGPLRVQGAVLVFARVMETWFEDDDPGLAKTMARLDAQLKKGGRILGYADHLHRLAAPMRALMQAACDRRPGRRRRARTNADDGYAEAI
ncbi:MAG: TetR/AcrR family transcriptional regulator [Hyphomicrobiaceae bacterium]